MNRTANVSRKTNMVGTRPAARTASRLQTAAAETETAGQIATAAGTRAHAWLNGLPLETWRWACRHHDYTAGLLAAAITFVAAIILRVLDALGLPAPFTTPLVALGANAGRILPVWFLTVAVGIGVGVAWHREHHQTAHRHRAARQHAKPITDVLRPRPGITGTFDDNEWRMLDILTIPQGHTAHQYIKKAPTLSHSLRRPVRISCPRPGILAVRRQLKDPLAAELPWALPAVSDPSRIWLGIDQDNEPVHVPLTRDGSARALFIIGAPDAGKSTLEQSITAQLVDCDHVLLDVADPADGIDLGESHPFAYRLGETPDDVIHNLELLYKEMQARRLHLKERGFKKHPPSAEFPMQVLVIDEISTITLHPDKATRDKGIMLLASIRRLGRKTNTAIVAATQDLRAEVIPKTITNLFSHRVCLYVPTYQDADVALPGARMKGYDPSALNPAHQGRGFYFDGATYTEVRTPNLSGKYLTATVQDLTGRRLQAVPFAPPIGAEPVQLDTISEVSTYQKTVIDTPSGRSTVEVDTLVAEQLDRNGHRGFHYPTFAKAIGETEKRIQRSLERLGARSIPKRRGWYAGEVR